MHSVKTNLICFKQVPSQEGACACLIQSLSEQHKEDLLKHSEISEWYQEQAEELSDNWPKEYSAGYWLKESLYTRSFYDKDGDYKDAAYKQQADAEYLLRRWLATYKGTPSSRAIEKALEQISRHDAYSCPKAFMAWVDTIKSGRT